MEKMEKLSQAKRILTRPSNCELEVCLSGEKALAWYAQGPGFNSQPKIERKEGRGKGKGEEEGMKGEERAYMQILCHFTDRDIDKVLGFIPSRKRRRRSRGEERGDGEEREGGR